ncbi:phenylalanine--tRNA ligase subunit beta [Leeia sp.]|uniref:phenylalanine--tRNA ligase subunit beta n=1 Tax=Leeia sp. TaxID=2884678 RepID=UPI0035B45984
MQFSEQWLRTLVNPALTTEQLTHLLTMAGLEVEDCDPVGVPFSKVVVGHILSTERHPNADRLNVCSVDVGGETLQIVCGAPNARAGIKIPCALVGAALPGESADKPFVIAPVKMRGVESFGMLCSARELRLSEDHGGLLELPEDSPVGADVYQLLQLDDQKITIKLTPNRADCLSLMGVAREVSALTDTPLQMPEMLPVSPQSDATFPARISSPAGCGRFGGRVIRNVDAKAQTPAWMVQRLERAGLRSISALVDVTNYVMLELGQPLHVYDLDRLQGSIDVRFGRAGEQLQLLNEQTVTVDESVLLITDDSGPIGLAGIMGGQSTKAELHTRHIYLEAAFFFPVAIAGRARRYNFSSDASHRFERGVDFDGTARAMERASQLIVEICGGEPGPVQWQVAELPARPPVSMRTVRARKLIGVDIDDDTMQQIFRRLGLPCQRSEEGGEVRLVVTPPSYRFDLEIEEDLVEEVARVYGFERIPARPPKVPANMRIATEATRSLHQLRVLLADVDYQEVINYSFVERAWERDFAGNDNAIALKNPIASHLEVMRSSLIGGLVSTLRYNLNRKAARVRLFELGKVFLRDASVQNGPLTVAGYAQPMRVAALAWGSALPEQWADSGRAVDFFDVKADMEQLLQASGTVRCIKDSHPALHPGRSARVQLNGQDIGWIGELHPQWVQAYDLPSAPVVFELEASPVLQVPLPDYQDISSLPAVRRDLALVVDQQLPAQQLVDDLRASAPALVTEISLFDVYAGKGIESGKKSLALRVMLHNTLKTLTDEEIEGAIATLLVEASRQHGAQLRN